MACVKLFYFTGSGNTLKVVNRVKETFEKKKFVCSIEKMEDKTPIDFNGVDYVGLLFPVAIQSTFPLVWNFIEDLPMAQGQKIFMIDTMQAFSGGIVGPVKKSLQAKGYKCVAAVELIMTNSMSLKNMNRDKEERKNRRALDRAEAFINGMLNHKEHWSRVPLLSDWMRNISLKRDIWTKESQHMAIDHEQCIGRGICIHNCPVEALSMVEGRVCIDHTLCISCMRCVHHCPKDAFMLKGKKVQRLK